jgi:hypothetical protein
MVWCLVKHRDNFTLITKADKGKGKVVLVLSFSLAPRHTGVLGEWRYSFMHS